MGIIWTPCTVVSTVQTPSTPDDDETENDNKHACVYRDSGKGGIRNNGIAE